MTMTNKQPNTLLGLVNYIAIDWISHVKVYILEFGCHTCTHTMKIVRHAYNMCSTLPTKFLHVHKLESLSKKLMQVKKLGILSYSMWNAVTIKSPHKILT